MTTLYSNTCGDSFSYKGNVRAFLSKHDTFSADKSLRNQHREGWFRTILIKRLWGNGHECIPANVMSLNLLPLILSRSRLGKRQNMYWSAWFGRSEDIRSARKGENLDLSMKSSVRWVCSWRIEPHSCCRVDSSVIMLRVMLVSSGKWCDKGWSNAAKDDHTCDSCQAFSSADTCGKHSKIPLLVHHDEYEPDWGRMKYRECALRSAELSRPECLTAHWRAQGC